MGFVIEYVYMIVTKDGAFFSPVFKTKAQARRSRKLMGFKSPQDSHIVELVIAKVKRPQNAK